jgi:hypothetical protein
MDRRTLLAIAAVSGLTPLAAHATDKADKKRAGGESYLQLQALLGTTIRSDGVRGVLSVECGLDVPDAALRTRAEQSIPRLRSAFVETIQSYARGLPTGSAPNADFLAQNLQRQADTILGRPGARVLLGAILVN